MRYEIGDAMKSEHIHFAHGVNCQGVMGSGIALSVKNTWPECYQEYAKYCKTYIPIPGEVFLWVSPEGKRVWNVFTQNLFGKGTRQVSYVGLARSIYDMASQISLTSREVQEIAIPKIGAGLGGGDWNIIEEILLDIEKETGVEFVVYELA